MDKEQRAGRKTTFKQAVPLLATRHCDSRSPLYCPFKLKSLPHGRQTTSQKTNPAPTGQRERQAAEAAPRGAGSHRGRRPRAVAARRAVARGGGG